MKTIVQCFLVVLGLSIGSIAAQEVELEKILLPVVTEREIPGAFGSRWLTRLSIVNASSHHVQITGYNDPEEGCQILCAELGPTPPGIVFYPSLPIFTNEVQGFFLRVDRRFANEIAVSLRAQDVSRQELTWGTELPVVRDSEWFTGKFQILDVPVRPGFRQHLRVYDADARTGARFKLRIFAVNPSRRIPSDSFGVSIEPDRLLLEREETFKVATSGGGTFSHPGFAELADFAGLPAVAGAEVVRLELEPLTPGLRFWGFVAIVNNETQHLTSLTPQ